MRSRKLNRLNTWQKISFKCTFCGFSFTPTSKCRKRPWNLYEYKNFLLEMYFPWSQSTECTSSFFRNLTTLVGSKQAKRSDPPWRKQGWIPRKTISYRKAFVSPLKGNWAFFWMFSFHLCLFSAYYQSWNAKLYLVLKTHTESVPDKSVFSSAL